MSAVCSMYCLLPQFSDNGDLVVSGEGEISVDLAVDVELALPEIQSSVSNSDEVVENGPKLDEEISSADEVVVPKTLSVNEFVVFCEIKPTENGKENELE